MPSHFSLLPNSRTSLTAAARPAVTGTTRRQVNYGLEVHRNGSLASGTSAVELAAQVLGAGDITGVTAGSIARIEPRRGARAFEPNYFPYVEFVDADFPWRYSLDTGLGNRIQPWLALVVLTDDEFEFVDQGPGPLPRIRVPNPTLTLPAIGQVWASVHVHIDRGRDGTVPVSTVVESQPENSLARMLSFRRLVERTRYTMFLVPTYEAGRLAGLGATTVAPSWDAPAWEAASDQLDLPYYFRSGFTTNALEDFELLVRRLRAAPADEIAGFGEPRIASAANPGYYPGFSDPGASFPVQAALQRPGTSLPSFATNTELAKNLATTLTTVIEGESVTSDGPGRADPLVAMPPYGWRFRQESSVDVDAVGKKQWFHRLNLDLTLRQVAGTGTEVVARHQESFMADAWDQYDEIVAANRRLAQLEAAKELVDNVVRRRIEPLPAPVVMSLQQPLHAIVAIDTTPVAEALPKMGIPQAFASVPLRKVAAKRPVRLPDTTPERTHIPAPSVPGDTTPDLRFDPPRRTPTVDAPPLASPEGQPSLFQSGAFTAPAAQPISILVQPFRSDLVARSGLEVMLRLPAAKVPFVVDGLRPAEEAAVAPILRSPRIARPLATLLERLDPNAMLAGHDKLPDNSVTVVEENRPFVESFLVGANHAMNNELRWRGFPTDMRGTVLPRFWDRGYGADDSRGDDIPAIHTWTDRIGKNFTSHDDGEADMVLTIRGDIVRKLGQLIVVLNEATSTTWKKGDGTNHHPVFSGTLGDDTAYYGFNIGRAKVMANKNSMFFVLYEPMGRLRFGLDIATASVRRKRFSLASASLTFPVQALQRSDVFAMPPVQFVAPPTAPPATPAKWDDLSWSHVVTDSAGYLDVDTTSVSVTTGPDYWSTDRTSASIARSMWQKPVAAVLPARRVL
ncbi:MAG: hypothetical protein OER95_10310 [Acidimicrobiia bacterium]|nr:hypothetical protein [Acidimicrobiia bacterium]